jgi:ATP-dependent exoDNAse (exonuclease V) beta subunit
VAELLKEVIDWLDYRAVLAASRSRFWRNVDKLLADAHASGMVRVRGFLDYLRTLRDVGAREGEAPADAEGAVRLMTVHKSKGLEFEIVVLADTSRGTRATAEEIYLFPETGPAFRMDRYEAEPLVYRIARWIDRQQSEAEENRLLYVAATRAKEKLIISGHVSHGRGRWSADGWLKQVLEVLEVDLEEVATERGWHEFRLVNDESISLWASPQIEPPVEIDQEITFEWPESKEKPLYMPAVAEAVELSDDDLVEMPLRTWRVTGEELRPPAASVGRMVHEAIRCWLFPEDHELDALLEAEALSEGLVEPRQRENAIRESKTLLTRLREHVLWEEIYNASERLHEVPYTRLLPDSRIDSGRIDLLYRLKNGWKLIDFKTDELRDQEALEGAVEEYRPQVTRYAQAVRDLLDSEPEIFLCFLDMQGDIELVGI